MYLDTITDSKTELFKFYQRYGKDLRCPNIQGKSGSQHFVKLNIQKCPALLWLIWVITLSLLVKNFVVCWYRLQTIWTQISCRAWPGSNLFDTLIWIYSCACHKRFWNNCFYGIACPSWHPKLVLKFECPVLLPIIMYKLRFSTWPSWISDRDDFSYFLSISHPNASYQVSSQLSFQFRRRSEKLIFKMDAMAAILDFR